MLIHNVGYNSLEWLINNRKIISVKRSEDLYIPRDVYASCMPFSCFNDLVGLVEDSAALLDCGEIANWTRGFDVEVESVDDNFPEEIKRRLG